MNAGGVRYVVVAIGCALCGLLTMGCQEQKPGVQIASSAPLASYAQNYPDEVNASIAAFGDADAKAKEMPGRFQQYPNEYDNKVDWGLVADALEHADLVGRSYAYVERLEEVRAVDTFYEDEKDVLRRKVAGAAQYTAQQAGCEADVASAAASTLDKAMEEQLLKRLREGNDAHRLVEKNRETLGPKNAAALEKQIDEVALASYLTNIKLVEARIRLERLAEEGSRVKQTADELIAAEKDYQSDSGRTEAQKKASSERINAMAAARGRMDSAERNAQDTLKGIEQRIQQTQKTYQEALGKLLEDLRARAPSS